MLKIKEDPLCLFVEKNMTPVYYTFYEDAVLSLGNKKHSLENVTFHTVFVLFPNESTASS